jgi:hypothetical protein
MTSLLRTLRRSELKWRIWDNFSPWLAYRASGARLTELQRSLLARLQADGIAVTHVDEFFGPGLWDELRAEVADLQERRRAEIQALRDAADRPGVKNYVIPLLGRRPRLDDGVIVRAALQPAVLDLVNAYLGLFAKFLQFNVLFNVRMAGGPIQSQLWHRDPEDRLILKMFTYLSDVGEADGPFCYARGTHSRGPIQGDPPSLRDEALKARRSTDEQMEQACPRSRWMTCTGPSGAVVLADTRGYHKGGYVRDRERILHQCTFTSHATSVGEFFERGRTIDRSGGRARQFALSPSS